MKCSSPFVQGDAEFGCGKCPPCLMNRRRLWTSRLMLEAQKHEFSTFVTLTYEEMPRDESVSVRDVQLFLKRLRKFFAPRAVRYYVVGEYGGKRGRPHYHAILYGLSVGDAEGIALSWGLGNVHCGTVTPESAAYVVSYISKYLTAKEKEKLKGRKPEFARMSLKPGIGAPAIKDFAQPIASGIDVQTGEFYGMPDGDVPGVFRFDGGSYPLGRYLKDKLRIELGFPKGEPVATGQLRRYRRWIDLSACGKRGYKVWQMKKDERQQSKWKALKHMEILLSKKGIGL